MKVRAVLLVSLLAGCGVGNSGDGEKIGQVVKVSRVGWFCKTWEGQLIRGGFTGGSGAMGTAPFDFTVDDEGLAKEVSQYMRDQTEVVVTYRQEAVYSLCRSESGGHFLQSIAPAKQVVR